MKSHNDSINKEIFKVVKSLPNFPWRSWHEQLQPVVAECVLPKQRRFKIISFHLFQCYHFLQLLIA